MWCCECMNYQVLSPCVYIYFACEHITNTHSLYYRTPSQILHEIVLVDDFSELENLHEKLDEEIQKPYYQGKVKIVRNKQREGLIRTRNIGAIAATGELTANLFK